MRVGEGGRLCVTNIGRYQMLLYTTYAETVPIPASWAYQSPEFLEEPSSGVSLASDVYSFACTIYKVRMATHLVLAVVLI